MISAKVICDSTTEWGDRLTTLEVTFHRYILSEFNTVRQFSRSSASSRAIPVAKQIKKVKESPALPVEYKYNQPGMQAAELMSEGDRLIAEGAILKLRDYAVETADLLAHIGPLDDKGNPLGLHKQWANRYLEPFMWHTVIVASTYWENTFRQRISPLAQPEFDRVAKEMKRALDESTPRLLREGEWNLPYIQDEEREEFAIEDLVKISTGRCARVSYLNHDGKRDIEADLKLYDRLENPGDGPAHAAPLEFVATPSFRNRQEVELLDFNGDPTGDSLLLPKLGNFLGFEQLRHRVLGF